MARTGSTLSVTHFPWSLVPKLLLCITTSTPLLPHDAHYLTSSRDTVQYYILSITWAVFSIEMDEALLIILHTTSLLLTLLSLVLFHILSTRLFVLRIDRERMWDRQAARHGMSHRYNSSGVPQSCTVPTVTSWPSLSIKTFSNNARMSTDHHYWPSVLLSVKGLPMSSVKRNKPTASFSKPLLLPGQIFITILLTPLISSAF